jgi:hypothetical protein
MVPPDFHLLPGEHIHDVIIVGWSANALIFSINHASPCSCPWVYGGPMSRRGREELLRAKHNVDCSYWLVVVAKP